MADDYVQSVFHMTILQSAVNSNRQSRIDCIDTIVNSFTDCNARGLSLGCKDTRLGDISVDLRGNPVVLADAQHLPFRAEAFSMVVFADVLEHLSDGSEIQTLREIWSVLREGGHLLLSTPRRDGF